LYRAPEHFSQLPITIKDDRPTLLMGDAATLRGGLQARAPDHGAKHFHVSHWTKADDSFTWTVQVPSAEELMVEALIRGSASTVELVVGQQRLERRIHTAWNRVEIGRIRLARGLHKISLVAPLPGNDLELYSLELTTPELNARLLRDAAAMRSDTAWMRQAKYGLQFHWTSQSQPRSGPRKPYAQAVHEFPAKEFASNVAQAGAGYVIFTTSHAEYFFPAPIKAIDRIMPGRTAERDLPRDLIEALGEYGIRLLLYYHTGHDHFREPDGWWARSGYDPNNPERFLSNWCAITSEVGSRYGKGLAGWFFDDSCVYYPLNPDFRRLTAAAKTANPERLVCYNPWIWPRCTDFQDYFCGEGYEFLKVRDNLPPDGSGIFFAGPQKGLQAHTNFILESDWCHTKANTEIPAPSRRKEDFVRDCVNGIQHGIIPSVNLEIYQDGGVSATSLAYLSALKSAGTTAAERCPRREAVGRAG
jgi:hypothetical protein